jgi:hypothetical protein
LSRQYRTFGLGKLITIDRLAGERGGVEKWKMSQEYRETPEDAAERIADQVSDSAQHGGRQLREFTG